MVVLNIIMKHIFSHVWKHKSMILTKNMAPGFKSFTEQLIRINKTEYRVWDPNRSKACAAITRGLKTFPLCQGMKILYLGIANGYTSSFFSDIIGPNGVIYGIEISERSIRDLNPVAEKRGNIVPILADARKPETYSWIEPVDLIYQDVATNDQSEIMIRNSRAFLKPGGHAMIAIKSRSIDVTKNPHQVYKQEEAKLSKAFKILEKKTLDPYEKDHLFLVMQPRGL